MSAADTSEAPVLGRIVRPADYARVLAAPLRLRSPHFAVHHLEGRPLPSKRRTARVAAPGSPEGDAQPRGSDAPVATSLSTELSTAAGKPGVPVVDDCAVELGETLVGAGGPRRWLGLVVPKRHAKRAVTRSLVKRQIRAIAAGCADRLAPGLWVVRQRSAFDPKQYPSAASDALRDAAREELRALFERAARGERDRVKPRGPAPGAAVATTTPPPPAEGTPCAA
jgi:ribonuclease P protein component